MRDEEDGGMTGVIELLMRWARTGRDHGKLREWRITQYPIGSDGVSVHLIEGVRHISRWISTAQIDVLRRTAAEMIELLAAEVE